MGIESLYRRVCKQTAVYWGAPTENGYGGFTYDDPVEIAVRWENKTEVITDSKGQEQVSKAEIFLTQDIDEQGMLFLGTLDDLDSAEEDDPTTVNGAYVVMKFEKIPDMAGREFTRKAYL